jgi:GntR family transcriptional regulator
VDQGQGLVLGELQLRYRRVQEALAEQIRREGRSPGSPLPPERALAEHFRVSRVTLRRALAELERSGVIARARGRGWVVAGNRIGEPPNVLMSFSEMAASRGLRPSSRVITTRVRPATIDEAETLGLAPGADLFELERVRMMDGVPILIDLTRIPTAIAPGLERIDFSSTSLYAELETRFGLRPTRARISVEAVTASDRQSELLGVDPGQPLLFCRQLTQDELGRLIELCAMAYRGDRYRLRATLGRPSRGATAAGTDGLPNSEDGLGT